MGSPSCWLHSSNIVEFDNSGILEKVTFDDKSEQYKRLKEKKLNSLVTLNNNIYLRLSTTTLESAIKLELVTESNLSVKMSGLSLSTQKLFNDKGDSLKITVEPELEENVTGQLKSSIFTIQFPFPVSFL